MSHLELVTVIVRDYDRAIEFFVNVLGFELVDDSPSLTNDGRPKRWVVVRPKGGETGEPNRTAASRCSRIWKEIAGTCSDHGMSKRPCPCRRSRCVSACKGGGTHDAQSFLEGEIGRA